MAALSGIHEVARELENPFRNVPNEIPVVTLQAQFNEALVTMYAGYHPDAFWDGAAQAMMDQRATGHSSPTKPKESAPLDRTRQLEEQVSSLLSTLEDQRRELASLRSVVSSSPGAMSPMAPVAIYYKDK